MELRWKTLHFAGLYKHCNNKNNIPLQNMKQKTVLGIPDDFALELDRGSSLHFTSTRMHK
jgi:hypothetical protein